MPQSLREIFSFLPVQGKAHAWPALVWVLSNGILAISFIGTSVALAFALSRVKDLPFRRFFTAFSALVAISGITHLLDVLALWRPAGWLDVVARGFSAFVAIGAALALPPLIPRAIALARGVRSAHDRGVALEAAVSELGTTYERTRELEQLKTQFFANVSHELRTPLALVLGPTAKLLAEKSLPESAQRELVVIEKNARVLLKHVNDLLDLSKLEEGKMSASYAEVDLARLVRLTASFFDSLAAERGINYLLEAPGILTSELDPDKIQRVIVNILSNAFKFVPGGGKITCVLTSHGGSGSSRGRRGKATICISDSGPGIRPEHRTVIFDRFRQLEGGLTRRSGGTGLGLAIAKDFVELHGGKIEVDDAPEGGARFAIELPLAAPAGTDVRADATLSNASMETARQEAEILVESSTFRAAPPILAESEPPSSPGPQFSPSSTMRAASGDELEAPGPLVLVVEDNEQMRRFVCESLAPHYRTATAADGKEGLARALELRPDLVLTDVMMPGMSGVALVRAIRRHPELDEVPIVLLTAKADDHLRVEVLKHGAHDYIMKPFAAEELKARIGNLVSMKRTREILERELMMKASDLETLAVEISRQKREISTALDIARAAREESERASQLKTNFLGLISHELRTPLTSLGLQLERLSRLGESTPSPVQDVLQRMRGSTRRLTDLIESLLEYARLEAGRIATHVQPVDLDGLLSQSVDELRPMAEAKGIHLSLEVPTDLPNLESDARLLRLIFVNLVSNAIKFTQKGSVAVKVALVEGEYRIDVHDSGPGIPLTDHGRIFEPFEQLAPLSGKHIPGVGLGLALVKELAKAIGAQVALQSAPGLGSTFTLVVPSRPPSARPASPRARAS